MQYFDTVTIGAHWSAPIVNDDRTGLSDIEEQTLDLWLDRHEGMTVVFREETANFDRDEISGFLSDCITADIYLNRGAS